MASKRAQFEGIPDGADITASQGTDLFDAVTPGTGGTITADTSRFIRGAASAKFTPVSGQMSFVQWRNLGAAQLATRHYLYLTAPAVADAGILRVEGAVGAKAFTLYLTGANALRLTDAAGAATVWTSAAAFPLNQWVRIETYSKPGSTATDGTITVAYFLGDSTSPVETYTSNTRNVGATPIANATFGKYSGATYATPFWIDDVFYTDTMPSLPGPAPADTFTPPPSTDPPAPNLPGSVTLKNGFEGGSDGGVFTSSSAGPGEDPFPIVVTGGAGSIQWSTAHPNRGSYSGRINPVASQVAYLAWNTLRGSRVSARAYLWFDAKNTDDLTLMEVSSAGTKLARLHLTSEGLLRFTDAGGAATLWTAPVAFPLGRWVRVEILVAVGSTTSNGSVHIAVFDGDSASPLYEYLSAERNFGVGLTPNTFRVGKYNPGAYATPFYIDDVVASDVLTGLPGPAPKDSLAIGFISPVTAEPLSRITVRAGSTGGQVDSWEWSQISGPLVNLTTPAPGAVSFRVPADLNAQEVVLGVRVIGPSGQSPEQRATIRIPPHLFWTKVNGSIRPLRALLKLPADL